MKSTLYSIGKIMLPLIVLAVMFLPAIAQQSNPGNASIEITSPTESESLPAGNVTITVDVRDFNLTEKLGQANVPGEGHLHYYMDVAVPKTPDQPATTAVGTFVPTANTSYTWQNVAAGNHNFSVQLANNDHTPVIPLAFAEINVTVEGTSGAMNATGENMSMENAAAGNASMGNASEVMAVPGMPAENMTTSTAESTAANVTSNASAQGENAVTVDLIASNIMFDKKKIDVPAGAKVTVNFDNRDARVSHNFAVYEDSVGKNAIFKGEAITGPNTTVYTFTAPSQPGVYYFRCDFHPSMNGQFVVS